MFMASDRLPHQVISFGFSSMMSASCWHGSNDGAVAALIWNLISPVITAMDDDGSDRTSNGTGTDAITGSSTAPMAAPLTAPLTASDGIRSSTTSCRAPGCGPIAFSPEPNGPIAFSPEPNGPIAFSPELKPSLDPKPDHKPDPNPDHEPKPSSASPKPQSSPPEPMQLKARAPRATTRTTVPAPAIAGSCLCDCPAGDGGGFGVCVDVPRDDAPTQLDANSCSNLRRGSPVQLFLATAAPRYCPDLAFTFECDPAVDVRPGAICAEANHAFLGPKGEAPPCRSLSPCANVLGMDTPSYSVETCTCPVNPRFAPCLFQRKPCDYTSYYPPTAVPMPPPPPFLSFPSPSNTPSHSHYPLLPGLSFTTSS